MNVYLLLVGAFMVNTFSRITSRLLAKAKAIWKSYKRRRKGEAPAEFGWWN